MFKQRRANAKHNMGKMIRDTLLKGGRRKALEEKLNSQGKPGSQTRHFGPKTTQR